MNAVNAFLNIMTFGLAGTLAWLFADTPAGATAWSWLKLIAGGVGYWLGKILLFYAPPDLVTRLRGIHDFIGSDVVQGFFSMVWWFFDQFVVMSVVVTLVAYTLLAYGLFLIVRLVFMLISRVWGGAN